MSSNPFVLEREAYNRDINILNHYVKQSSEYLALMTGKPIDVCVDFVKRNLKPGGMFEFKDPEIVHTERMENGDRELRTGTLLTYLTDAIKDKELIAPTLTTYLNPSKKKSLLVDFIDDNVKARSRAKKAMFAAEVAGDVFTYTLKKLEQGNKKISNNSLSGAQVSSSTPLYNKTAHSTLTSNCRSTSGYGNANNEKFLAGNRHYWSLNIVLNNIASIITNSDYDAISKVIAKYNLCYPTIDQAYECLARSCMLYWRNKQNLAYLYNVLTKLSPVQLAAIVYTGDLYHLMKYNEQAIRTFISKLSAKVYGIPDDHESIAKLVTDDISSLVAQICTNELKDTSVRDIKISWEKEHANGNMSMQPYDIFLSTAKNTTNVLTEYTDFLRTFFVTNNVPASMGHFPNSIRRVAITSDTDSTIFTVQDWVIWYKNGLSFDEEADAVAACMIFLASQSIIHVLARMSANFGIEKDKLFQIAMKNEFKFPVFVATSVAKHYFNLISCQEGNVKSAGNFKKQIAGVHLKSSNAPPSINKDAEKLMMTIMEKIMAGKKLSANNMIRWVAKVELGIIKSLQQGSHEYFRRAQINVKESYKNKENTATYQQYLMWEFVFAPIYGSVGAPPYTCLKVSVDLDSPMKTKEWLLSIEDKELVARIQNWMNINNKLHLGSSMLIPEQVVASKGMPKEILTAIGLRKFIRNITTIYYLILDAMGVCMLNDKTTRLCMDYYKEEVNNASLQESAAINS